MTPWSRRRSAPHPNDAPAPDGDDGVSRAVDDEVVGAPLGEVLGPLTVWAVTVVAAALAGEMLGERLAAAMRAGQVRVPAAAIVPALTAVLGSAATGVAAVALFAARRIRRERGGSSPSDHRMRLRPVTGSVGVVLIALVVVPAAVVRVISTDLGILPRLAEQGGERRLEAVVAHEPRPIATGWHVLVRVTAIDGVSTRERAALTLDSGLDPPALGSRWHIDATARPLPDGGYGRWLHRQHAAVVLDVRSFVPAGSPGWLAAASEHVRSRIREAATHHLADRTAGLLVGFVSGDTRLLPEDDQEAMRATSLTHLTAVSGANVAIVVGGVLLFLGVLRIGATWRRRIVAITVIGFAFLTRFEPSVLRAGGMALLVLLVGARGMPRDTRHALSGAVLLLVLLDPRLAGSLGLLLSATATAGVLMIAPLVARRLHRLPRRLREVASISIGAQIAVVPLLLTTFGEVPLASVPANIVAVPAAAIAAVLSFLGSVLALAHVQLGAPLFWLAGAPAQVVLASAHGFQGLGGVADTGRPVTVLALVAASTWVLTDHGSRAARRTAVVALGAVVVAALPQLQGLVPPRTMTVTAIDVGQGDAFLIETPRSRILVDAGGDDTAATWLRRNGRRHLDLVIVTHPHLDHVGGVPDVLRSLDVDTVWYRPPPTELPEAAEVVSAAAERGVPIRSPVSGEVTSVGDATIEVLHPPSGRPYRWSGSELNDTSIVVRVTHEQRRVLATGDIERAPQADLLAGDLGLLEADVLTVPHHGAATTDPAFLAAVGPRVALISVGHDNRYGHPHPETVAALKSTGAEVRRTDLDGTVRIEVPAPARAAPRAALARAAPRAALARAAPRPAPVYPVARPRPVPSFSRPAASERSVSPFSLAAGANPTRVRPRDASRGCVADPVPAAAITSAVTTSMMGKGTYGRVPDVPQDGTPVARPLRVFRHPAARRARPLRDPCRRRTARSHGAVAYHG